VLDVVHVHDEDGADADEGQVLEDLVPQCAGADDEHPRLGEAVLVPPLDKPLAVEAPLDQGLLAKLDHLVHRRLQDATLARGKGRSSRRAYDEEEKAAWRILLFIGRSSPPVPPADLHRRSVRLARQPIGRNPSERLPANTVCPP